MNVLKKILPLIGIALFVYLILRIGIKNIVAIITNARFPYLCIVFLCMVIIVLLQAFKWYIILRKQKINLKFQDAIKLQLISIFYGIVTPARIGSFIKISYLQEKVKNFGKAASSVVIDRFFDMLTVLIFACIGTLIILNQFPYIAIFIFGVFVVSLAFFALIISKNKGQKIVRLLYEKLLPKSIKGKTRKGFRQFYTSIPKKRYLILPFILNVITWLVIYAQFFIVAKAIAMDIPYFVIIFMFPIATIISEIPASIAGLGIREASLITLLGFFGVKADAVMAISIISLVMTNLFPALLGLILAIKGYGLKNKKIKTKLKKSKK